MFENFGEFDSCAEINLLATNLLAEGDTESIMKLALENGIDEDDALDFIDGCVDDLCTPLMAAQGKLSIERDSIDVPASIFMDWLTYIRGRCMESVEFCVAVRHKNKSLAGCFAAILKWSFSHQYTVPADIIKAAGISASKVTLGIPGQADAKEIITKYYMEG